MFKKIMTIVLTAVGFVGAKLLVDFIFSLVRHEAFQFKWLGLAIFAVLGIVFGCIEAFRKRDGEKKEGE